MISEKGLAFTLNMSDDCNKLNNEINDIIAMFFAQKQLYERAKGLYKRNRRVEVTNYDNMCSN